MPLTMQGMTVWGFSLQRVYDAILYCFYNAVPILLPRLTYILDDWYYILLGLFLLVVLTKTRKVFYTSLVQREAHNIQNSMRKKTLRFCSMLTIFSLGIVTSYMLCTSAWYAYPRYFAPLFLIGIPIFVFFIINILTLIDETISIVLIISYFFQACLIMAGLYTGDYGKSVPYKEQIPLIMKNVPNEERVAATYSAVLGYFRDNVLSLDHKENIEAKRAYYKNDIYSYIKKENIAWICDTPQLVNYLLGKSGNEKYKWRIVDRMGSVCLYHYEGENSNGRNK